MSLQFSISPVSAIIPTVEAQPTITSSGVCTPRKLRENMTSSTYIAASTVIHARLLRCCQPMPPTVAVARVEWPLGNE